jgi:hypothetical protein
LPRPSVPGMPTTSTRRNTGFATIAAAAAPRRARRRCAWPPGRSPASGWPSVTASASRLDEPARADRDSLSSPLPRSTAIPSLPRMRPSWRNSRTTWISCASPAIRSGAKITVTASGVPPGWGEPVYGPARCRDRLRDDGHQRGQGGRDRRRFCQRARRAASMATR